MRTMRKANHADGEEDQGSAGATEVFGFAGWAASGVAFACYTAWAFLPESYLHAAGITYYPSRTWAIVLPTWALVLIVFCFWLYEGLNQSDVAPFSSLKTVKDSHCKNYEDLGLPGVTTGPEHNKVLPLVHIPPTVVSKVLYGGMPVEEALESERRHQRSHTEAEVKGGRQAGLNFEGRNPC